MTHLVVALLAGCRIGPALLLLWPFRRLLLLRLVLLGVGLLVFGTALEGQGRALFWGRAAGPVNFGEKLGLLCCRELLIGATLALAASLPFAAARSAGRVFDESRFASDFATAGYDGLDQTGPLATAAVFLAVFFFMTLSGPLIVFEALARSYEIVPLAGGGLTLVPGPLIAVVGGLFVVALALVLPFLAGILLAQALIATLQQVWDGGEVGAAARFFGHRTRVMLTVMVFLAMLYLCRTPIAAVLQGPLVQLPHDLVRLLRQIVAR